MAADENENASPDDPAAVRREMLRHARDNCRRLTGGLHRDALHLQNHRPSPLVPEDVLTEGRALYLKTASAAEELLQRIEQSLGDEPAPTPAPSPTDHP